MLEAAVKTLHKIPGITGSTKSSWYKTKAVEAPQPDCLNGCISLYLGYMLILNLILLL
ncbi:MAG: hypothetical protein AAFV71_10715 [Cyanobacteria bacterium J06633_8]